MSACRQVYAYIVLNILSVHCKRFPYGYELYSIQYEAANAHEKYSIYLVRELIARLTVAVATIKLHNRFRNSTLKHVFFCLVGRCALGMQFFGSNLIVFAIPITQARGFNQFIYRDEVCVCVVCQAKRTCSYLDILFNITLFIYNKPICARGETCQGVGE